MGITPLQKDLCPARVVLGFRMFLFAAIHAGDEQFQANHCWRFSDGGLQWRSAWARRLGFSALGTATFLLFVPSPAIDTIARIKAETVHHPLRSISGIWSSLLGMSNRLYRQFDVVTGCFLPRLEVCQS